MGATQVDAKMNPKPVEISEEILNPKAKIEIKFFWILILGMSYGLIILTLKKNDWAWNTGTLHLHARKNSNNSVCGMILLTDFWDSKRVYRTEFLKARKTVKSAQYTETIKNLRRRVCRVRGSTYRICCCITMQDRTLLAQRWCSGDAEVWGSLPFVLHHWLGANRFPFLSLRQEGSQKGTLSPQMMKWIKLWHSGKKKEMLNFLLTACVNLFRLGKMYWTTGEYVEK